MAQRIGIVVEPSLIPGYSAAFNPAVYLHEPTGEINLFCRLVTINKHSEIRRIVLDRNFKIKDIEPAPVLRGQGADEKLGCEDPRLTGINDTYYLVYTAVGKSPSRKWQTRIGIACSKNLSEFQRLGTILHDRGNNKNGVLIPKNIDGFFWLYHRIKPNVHLAQSEDLSSWHDLGPVMKIRRNSWDSHHIGLGTPPVLTAEGYLSFYHGADTNLVYRIGAAVFDAQNPAKLLARSGPPLLEPEESYEKEGVVPNVVFTCGAIDINGSFLLFYGAADKVTAACEITKKEVMQNLKPT